MHVHTHSRIMHAHMCKCVNQTWLSHVYKSKTKMDYNSKVKEFHQTFGHPVLDSPQLIPQKRSSLRVELISEELKELQTAINDGDIVEIADALCDLQYVLSGTILEFGLEEKFNALFQDVHDSNMSKVCHNEDQADRSVKYYQEKDIAVFVTKREINGKMIWIISRLDDNKILKNVDYRAAALKVILES